MAVSFAERIQALSGFDAGSSSASEIGEDYKDVTAEWMNVAVKEVVNILTPALKQKCAQISIVNATNGTTLDMDGKGEILQVTRKNADSGYHSPCRKIPAAYGDASNDSTNMMYYSTATDPVYWIVSNSSDASTLFVKPTPTDAQPSNVYHITYPVFDASGSGSNVNVLTATSIANFPDEAENLVVIKAAIIATQYQLAIEEDVELYGAILTTLQSDYVSTVQAMKAGEITPLQQGK